MLSIKSIHRLSNSERDLKLKQWLAVLIDGSITITQSHWQLSLTATQKTSELLTPIVDLYGGYVYIDRGNSQSYKWYITKKEDRVKLIEYFKEHPSRSAKNNR